MSADTIVPGYANPQAFNRYSYVLGNPLKYTDPTGHGQCQTYEDCADMGTTPMGTGGSTSGGSTSGGGNSGGGNHHDDDLPDPNPNGVPAPAPIITTPTPVPPATPSVDTMTSSTSAGLSLFPQSGSILGTIPALPPSPFACGWFDCTLSVVSFVASAATMTEVPEIVIPAIVVDLVATGIAIVRTNEDHSQGEISDVQQWALNGTSGLGLIPGPWGTGFSFVNVLVTLSGYPN